MTSAQHAANRANAQFSTGPRTEEGKSRSRMNGYSHGLTGLTLVMTEEEHARFEFFSASLMKNLSPVGALEQDLAQSIAMDRWRLNRIKAIEQNLFAMAEFEDPDCDPSETFQKQSKQLNLLTLYESRISRNVERTLKQLKQLQTERLAKDDEKLHEAALIYKLKEMKGLPFDAQADGFGFSTPEIAHRALLDEARAAHKAALKRAA